MDGTKNHVLFATLCSLLIVSLASAENPPKEAWVARYIGLGNNHGYPLALTVDNSGNVYVTGTSQAPGVGPSADGGKDYATIKYDRNGKELWVARYDGPGDDGPHNNGPDEALAIAVDNSGNVYVTGYSRANLNESGCATIKYNSEGKQLWIARGGPNGGSTIALDNSGNVYVSGGSSDDKNRPTYTTVKYDSNGQKLWVRHSDCKGIPTCPSEIELDDLGNVYVNGLNPVKYKPNGDEVWAKSFGRFLRLEDPNSFYYIRNTHSSRTGLDSELSKYDQNGNRLWLVRYNGSANAYDCLEYLGADRYGNVYVAGTSEGKGTGVDIVTIKYRSNGNELWVACYNGLANGDDIVGGMVVDDSGNVYLAGSSESVDSYDKTDVVTLKYDPNGKQLWEVKYRGNFGSIRDLTIDGSGNVYVTGSGGYKSGEYVTIKYSQQNFRETQQKTTFEPTSYAHFNQNKVLAEKEKAYVKRMYAYVSKAYEKLKVGYEQQIDEGALAIPDELYEMELYRKWGLGEKRVFSEVEKYYLLQLPMIEQSWQTYNTIDINNLSEPEKAFLEEMHSKYGDGPINIREETRKQQGKLKRHQELWFDLINAITGTDKLNDRDLVLLYKLTPR